MAVDLRRPGRTLLPLDALVCSGMLYIADGIRSYIGVDDPARP